MSTEVSKARMSPANRDAYALLYFVTFIVVSVAPSLGLFGTVARTSCAVLGVVAAGLVYLGTRDARRLRGSEQAAVAIVVGALLVASVSPVGPAYVVARLFNWLMFWPMMFVFFHRPRYPALAAAAITGGMIQATGVVLQARGVLGGVWGGALISGNEYNPMTSEWLTRYTGFVQDPNNLAILMNLSAIAAVTVMILNRSVALRTICGGAVAISVMVVVFSGSRGGLLALPIGFFVYALIVGTRGIAALLATAAIGAYLAVSFRWDSLNNLVSTLTGALDGHDQSLVQRFAVWSAHPVEGFQYLVGSGFGGYDAGAFSGSGFDIASDSARSATVDNAWLKLLLEGGAIAVCAFLAIFVVAFAAVVRGRRGERTNRVLAAGVGAALTILLWRSISTDALDINPFNFILPMVVGACFAVGSTSPAAAKLPRPARLRRTDAMLKPAP